jgi:hypothetical protein
LYEFTVADLPKKSYKLIALNEGSFSKIYCESSATNFLKLAGGKPHIDAINSINGFNFVLFSESMG